MAGTRIFVGGLAVRVEEKHIQKHFSKYGTISSIEVKEKKDLDGNIISKFAYFNIDGESNSIDDCVSTLNGSSWKGSMLKVERAKESFLTRLKREREEKNTKNSTSGIQPFKGISLEDPNETAEEFENNYLSNAEQPQKNYHKKYLNENVQQQMNYEDYNTDYNEHYNNNNVEFTRNKYTGAERYDPTQSSHLNYEVKKKKPKKVGKKKLENNIPSVIMDEKLDFSSSNVQLSNLFSTRTERKSEKQYVEPRREQPKNIEKRKFFIEPNDPILADAVSWITTKLNDEYEKEFWDVRPDLVNAYKKKRKKTKI